MHPLRRASALSLLCAMGCTIGCAPQDDPAPVTAVPTRAAPLIEVTVELGLASNGAAWPDGSYFLPEITGPGVALFDHDGDGDLDLYQVRVAPPGHLDEPAPNRLFEQQPDGTFVDVTERAGVGDSGFGQGVAVGDVDNDGDLDLFVANYDADAFYLNNGDGTFRVATDEAGFEGERWSSSATFCDYDRDGYLDLYVTHYVKVDYEGSCRTSSGLPEYCGPETFNGEPDRLYHNNGDGTFSDVTRAAGIRLPHPEEAKGLGVVCLDLTGDDWADIYVANDGEANQLWVNRGDGTFVDQSLVRGVAFNRHGKAEASMGIGVGDFNRDGALDLFLTHLTQENNTLYMSGYGRLFMDRTVESGLSLHDLMHTGFGTGFFDLDHDGDLDLAVANGEVRRDPTDTGGGGFWSHYAEPNLLFKNIGLGRFDKVRGGEDPFAARVEVSRALAFGDLDGDGDLDLVFSNIDNSLRVYRNDAPPAGNRWVIVRALTGLRDAIGARVTVNSGDRVYVAAVLAGYSYQSSSDPRAHFGLGTADRIERIEVTWPDGSREQFGGFAVDREIVVTQGSGSTP